MATWRCPRCGTLQAEASRCWMCARSATSCSTCRHFRRGVAAGMGYCALDRRRSPLDGDEIRGCWEADLPAATLDGLFAGPAWPDRSGADVAPARDAGRRELVDAPPVTPARGARRPAVSGS